MEYVAKRVEDVPIPPPANYVGQAQFHGLTAPLGDGVVIREPLPYRGRIPGDDRVGLSPQEIEHFKTHGYLVKRGLVDDGDGLRGLLDYVWDHIPPAVLERANPATWVDGPAARMTAAEAQRLGVFQGSSFKLRSPREFGTEPFVLALTAGHPHVRRVAEQFLGRPLRPARRVRGFYVTFPKPVKLERKLGPHGDQVASDLAAMVIIDEIPPRCGGFTVWPGTHRALHPYFDTCHGGRLTDPQRLAGYLQARDRLLDRVVPVEFVGAPGDVVFWHPRILHSAGVNYSAEMGHPRVRIVVPCDFQRDGHTFFPDERYGPGEREQWWVDSRNYREDVPPTPDNLWSDWALESGEGGAP